MARSLFTQSELALVVAQFCSAPEITATYSACACYGHWSKMSNVRDILPVLWNIDHVGEIVLCYMKSCYDSGHSESDEESLYGDDLKEVEEAKDQHVATCISLYMRYEFLMDRLMLGQSNDASPHLCYDDLTFPLTIWAENEMRSSSARDSFFVIVF